MMNTKALNINSLSHTSHLPKTYLKPLILIDILIAHELLTEATQRRIKQSGYCAGETLIKVNSSSWHRQHEIIFQYLHQKLMSSVYSILDVVFLVYGVLR